MEVLAFCLGGLMETCEMLFLDFVAEMFCSSWNSFDFFGGGGKRWKNMEKGEIKS